MEPKLTNSMLSADKYIRESISGIFSPREASQVSMMILEKICGLSRLDILMGRDSDIKEEHKSMIDAIIERLINNEPLQYILGDTMFMDMNFNVNCNVLIPRPETAELIGLIISENKKSDVSILDIGTGSGCIAISLARNIPDSHVTAFDISEGAIETASLNAKLNNVYIDFRKTDILHFSPSGYVDYFDIIVSNPPYITKSEMKGMENNVLDFEPHLALFVSDEDPLVFYYEIARHSLAMLRSGGRLYFEINCRFGKSTADMLEGMGYSEISVIKDMQGRDRMISATLVK